MTDYANRIKADIQKYGVHIIHVRADEDEANFSYTIGLTEVYNKPEIIMIGQSQELHQIILNNMAYDYKDGRILSPGKLEENILDEYPCMIVDVDKKYFEEYLGIAVDYYNHKNFKVLQIVWPTQLGIFPNDKDAPDGFKKWQPILGKLKIK